jgi:hypothetical protein
LSVYQHEPIVFHLWYGWYGDDKQTTPTQIAIPFDAGLKGDIPVAEEDALEHLLHGEDCVGFEVAEGTVRAVGLESLILENFVDDEILYLAVAINEADFISHFQVKKGSAGKVVMGKQSGGSVLARHAELSDFIRFIGQK